MAKKVNYGIMRNTFNIYGNLLFYPNKPERMFFFSTLKEQDLTLHGSPTTAQYQIVSKHIAQQAQNYFQNNALTNNNTGFLNRESNAYHEKINQLLQFLNSAIQEETSNELAYFKQKKQLIYSSFSPEEINHFESLKDLLKFFQNAENMPPDKINYDEYIILINAILQGKQNFEAIVNAETQHLKDLDKAHETILNNTLNKVYGLNKKQRLSQVESIARLDKAQNKVEKNIRAEYLEKHTLVNSKGYKEIMRNTTDTVTVQIAKFITDTINKIWDSPELLNVFIIELKKHYESKNGRSKNFKATEENIKKVLIKAVVSYCSAHIKNILSGSIQESNLVDVINNMIQDENTLFEYQIQNMPNDFGTYGRHLEFFKNANSVLETGTKTAKGLYEITYEFKKRMEAKLAKERTAEQQRVLKILDLTRNGDISKSMTFIHDLERLQRKIQQQIIDLPNQKIYSESFTYLNEDKKTKTVRIQIKVDKNGKLIFVNDKNDAQFTQFFRDSNILKFLGSNNSKAKTLQGFIASLKSKTSSLIRNKILTNKVNDQLLKQIETQLQNIRISVSGPMLEEIMADIQLIQRGKDLVLYWGNHQNNKNDNVTIQLFDDMHLIQKNLQLSVSDYLLPIFTNYIDESINKKRELLINFQDNFSTALTKMKNNTTKQRDYHNYKEKAKLFEKLYSDYMTAYQKFLKELEQSKKTLNELTKQSSDKGEIKEIQQKYHKKIEEIQQILLKSLIRSDTMKTFNNYQNKIGFVGGSIGTTIHQQLSNLMQLFELAGMKMAPNEIKLLQDLIVNTTPVSLIGEKYKDPIQNYLSAMAAFALFDEGGEEVKLLKQTLTTQQQKKIKSNVGILHMYKLNGIYYPGSFILRETYKGINDINTFIQSESENIMNHGATITITNNISSNDIPNRNLHKHNRRLNTHPWQAVSKKAHSSTKLYITFMAGMLQVLTNLQKRMNEIIVPA